MGNRSRADVRRSIHKRIRKKISGTTDRPRLAVYRSTNHIYAQVIDDVSGKTLVSASSVEKDFRGGPGGNVKAAEAIGKAIAERAIGAGISEVVFDRGGYIYHGRVKALLDATRSAGLNKSEGNDKPRNGKKGSKPESGADVAAEKPEKKAKDEKPKKPKTEKPKKAADAKEADAGDAKKPAKADGAKKKAPKKNEKPEEVVSTEEDEGTNE